MWYVTTQCANVTYNIMIYYTSKRWFSAINSKQFAYMSCIFWFCNQRHVPGTANFVR
jgi:hypothetical protein